MTEERILYTTILAILIAILLAMLLPERPENDLRSAHYWATQSNDEKIYDIVVAGDSRIYRAISPKVLEDNLNMLTAKLVSHPGAGYTEAYFNTIERSLDSKGGQIIILGITPRSLTQVTSGSNHMVQEQQRKASEVFKRKYLYEKLGGFARIRPGDILRALSVLSSKTVIQEKYLDGWSPATLAQNNPGLEIPDYIHEFTDLGGVEEERINNLIEQVNRWTSSGTMVIGFRPPSTIQMRELEERLGGFKEDEFIKKFSKAGGIWIPFQENEAIYVSYDGSHLNEESGLRLSNDFSIILRDILEKDRRKSYQY